MAWRRMTDMGKKKLSPGLQNWDDARAQQMRIAAPAHRAASPSLF